MFKMAISAKKAGIAFFKKKPIPFQEIDRIKNKNNPRLTMGG